MMLQAVNATLVADQAIRKDENPTLLGLLVTNREREVLQKMSEGLTVKEIAASLFVSCHTIISHKKNLIEKFEARNSMDLIVKAIRNRVVVV